MNHKIFSGLLGCFLATFGVVACTTGDVDADDETGEELGTQASAQAKQDPPEDKAGKGCTATSKPRNTTVSNGTYSSNGSGGYNCCSSAGPNQVCINCAVTGTNTCTDKAKTSNPRWPIGPVAPIGTFTLAP